MELTACRSSEKCRISWGEVLKIALASTSLKTCVYTGSTSVTIFWIISFTRSLLHSGSMAVEALIMVIIIIIIISMTISGSEAQHGCLKLAPADFVLSPWSRRGLCVPQPSACRPEGRSFRCWTSSCWPASFFTPVSLFLIPNALQNCRSCKYTQYYTTWTHLMRKLTLCNLLPNLFMHTTAIGFLFKIDCQNCCSKLVPGSPWSVSGENVPHNNNNNLGFVAPLATWHPTWQRQKRATLWASSLWNLENLYQQTKCVPSSIQEQSILPWMVHL